MSLEAIDEDVSHSLELTCCFSAAVVICGKTFTVTQQEEEESSTTTAKLEDKMEHRPSISSLNIYMQNLLSSILKHKTLGDGFTSI